MTFIHHGRDKQQRRGTAAVETSFLMPLLLIMMVGVWEVGRIVQVQEILNNAARTGARLAAQATIINTTGAYTQICWESGASTPNVQDTVTQYLAGAGLTLNNPTVTFAYATTSSTVTEPYQGVKNQPFTVTVTINYSDVQWSTLSVVNITTMTAVCNWQLLLDDPLTVGTTLPSW